MKNISFGMPTLIEKQNLEDSVLLCKELGLDFIELNMNMPDYQIEQLENTETLRQIAERYDIYFTIHLEENLNVCDFNHAVAHAYQDTVRRAILVAKKLEIPILNMHMNHGVHFTLPDKKVELFERYNAEYMKNIEHFLKLCEDTVGDSNVRICIENTDGYQAFEKDALNYLLASPVFGLTWDIGHSHAAANVDEPFILRHSDKLMHFHIHDEVKNKNHLVLGSGEIDIGQRLSIAAQIGCRCVIETKTEQALIQSVNWLDAIANR